MDNHFCYQNNRPDFCGGFFIAVLSHDRISATAFIYVYKGIIMQAISLIDPITPATESLRQCCLLTDGNAHRTDLLAQRNLDFAHNDKISEAMLPEIRTIAMLIAASRHDFSQTSPAQFTDEADWFAARIIVLNVRHFHLNVRLAPMLHLANQRAEQFAAQHDLPFTPAQIRPSLHQKRPNGILLMDCAITGTAHENLLENSRALRALLFKIV
ncbi:hypothetical protein QG083_07925 [Kingella kingae]|uniref:hypothetical protein n=1 Tax=Kingella kingae TaxID=504 RepID=UPI00254FDA80|nr:hypothetical protein [Kingella kingae]MDK4613115.1 hypothetical protein [Kingella kingae]